jgi:hypothetical protein
MLIRAINKKIGAANILNKPEKSEPSNVTSDTNRFEKFS